MGTEQSGNIEIRELRLSDIPSFAQLRNQIDSEAEYLVPKGGERKENFARILGRMILSGRRTHVFLAFDGKKPVGYLTLVFAKFKKFRGNAYLTIAVRANYRNRGIGSRLMDAAEAFAKVQGKSRIELEVFGKNTGAIELYKRRGYVIEGTKKNAVQDEHGFDDIIVMAKSI